MQIVGFVPARGGSTRVPQKNLQTIGEQPLFLRACYNLHQILAKTDIYVDSDDQQILAIAQDHGFCTIRRPASLATNATDGNAFFSWETSQVPNADAYFQHLPPMPFCSKQTLEACIATISNNQADSVVCVGKEHYYLWDDQKKQPLYDLVNIPNSYNLPATVYEGMGLYLITASAHRASGLRIAGRYHFIELPRIERIDIDYSDDLQFARTIYKGLADDSIYKAVPAYNCR